MIFGGKLIKGNSWVYYDPLNTVEYLVLGDNTWKKLPPMHCKRAGATACVLP